MELANKNNKCEFWLLATSTIEDANGILDVMFEEIFVHGNNEKFKTALLLIGNLGQPPCPVLLALPCSLFFLSLSPCQTIMHS